ncbi:MAG TPA: low molecular weight protein arginine phosphatase [Gemmatimonadetes bacterium]|nr:low molecular weight protein arginine phosphatase [Gemmatimonadota bacterium]
MDPVNDTGSFRLLFVCTGNTCRSPMAEVIARHQITELGWSEVDVGSAGVSAWEGSPPSGGAVRAAAANGLDLSGHSSTYLSQELVEKADLILTMSASHVVRAQELGAGEKVALLPAFTDAQVDMDRVGGIPDPIGGSDEEYAGTFEVLYGLIELALMRIQSLRKP